MKHNHVTLKCPQCGKLFKLGYNGAGTLGAATHCDDCQGIERDAHGVIWHPWENEASFIRAGAPLDDETAQWTVTRAEAFGK